MKDSALFLLIALWTCTVAVNVADYIRPPAPEYEERGAVVFFITVVIHMFNI